MTFEEGVNELLAHLRLDVYRPATIDNYSDQLKRFGEWLRRRRIRDLRALACASADLSDRRPSRADQS